MFWMLKAPFSDAQSNGVIENKALQKKKHKNKTSCLLLDLRAQQENPLRAGTHTTRQQTLEGVTQRA